MRNLMLVTLFGAALVTSTAHALKKPRVLVMPVTSDGALQGKADAVTSLVLSEALKVPDREVKALRDVESVLDMEQKKQMLGCVGATCAADLAGALEAEQVIQGQLSKVDADLMVTLVRLRVRDAVSLSRQTERVPAGAAMDEKIRAMTRTLFKDEVAPQITLDLRVLAKRKGTPGAMPMQAGETLREGDELAFEFTVTPAAHVYLIQKTKTSGTMTVLFPQPGINVVNPLTGGATARIPSGNDFFEVDNQDLGTEHIYVVASTREMPRLQEAVVAMAQEHGTGKAMTAEEAMLSVLADGKACSRKGGLDSPGCASRTRGLKLKSADKAAPTARLSTMPGDDAVFYTFTFEHVAASPK